MPRALSSTVTYTYETTTSRLKSVLDALGQTKQYGYANDNLLTAITYLNAVNATSNVAFAYNPYFQRRLSMTDGTGTTIYRVREDTGKHKQADRATGLVLVEAQSLYHRNKHIPIRYRKNPIPPIFRFGGAISVFLGTLLHSDPAQ